MCYSSGELVQSGFGTAQLFNVVILCSTIVMALRQWENLK